MPWYDLGALGPAQGQSILYHWRWYYSVPSLSLWVVLLMATVVPKANRRWGVLLILAPVVVLYGGWLAILNWVLPSDAAQDESIGAPMLSLAIGPALLWLLGHMLAGGTWRRTLLGALAVTTGVAILTTLSSRFEISAHTLSEMGGLSILMLALVGGYALAGRRCHGRYCRGRFVFWLAVWMVILAVSASLVFWIFQCTFMGLWSNPIIVLLGIAALAGLAMGVMTFLVSLPFLLIGLHSPLFRPRFFACLRLSFARDPSSTSTASP